MGKAKTSVPLRIVFALGRKLFFRYTTHYAIQAYASPFTEGNRCHLLVSICQRTFDAPLRSDFLLKPTCIGLTLSPTHCDVHFQPTLSIIAFVGSIIRKTVAESRYFFLGVFLFGYGCNAIIRASAKHRRQVTRCRNRADIWYCANRRSLRL